MRVPAAADLNRAAAIFKGLAHPDRVRLACSLADGRVASQKELLRELHWPQSTMARHIGVLRDRGLLKSRRKGSETRLQIAGTVTPRLLDVVCQWVHPATGEEFAGPLTSRSRRRS